MRQRGREPALVSPFETLERLIESLQVLAYAPANSVLVGVFGQQVYRHRGNQGSREQIRR